MAGPGSDKQQSGRNRFPDPVRLLLPWEDSTIFTTMKTVPGIILLIAVLTLVVAPATCSAGVLVHCCAPEESDHEADHHEHACPIDPCNRESVMARAKAVDDDEAPDGADTDAVLPASTAGSAGRDDSTRMDATPLLTPVSTAVRSLPQLC